MTGRTFNIIVIYDDGVPEPSAIHDTTAKGQESTATKMMQTKCPKCNRIFETDLSAVGQWETCPECGGEWCVLTPEEERSIIEHKEEKAAASPHIEKKQKAKASFWKSGIGVSIRACFILGTSGFIFIGIPAWLIYSMYSCATAPKTESVSHRENNIDAWVFTQYLVEEHLKSPKSAEFPFDGAQNHVEETVPGIFIIRSYVDSQNSFGAMIEQIFFCKLQVKNGKFEVLQLTFN